VFSALQSKITVVSSLGVPLLKAYGVRLTWSISSRPPKQPLKVFGVRRIMIRFQPCVLKLCSIRCGSIQCPASQARSRSTWDAPDTPNTTKNEAGSHLLATTSTTVDSRLLFLFTPPLPCLSPLCRCSICRPSRRQISSESGTAVAAGSLAGLFGASILPTRPRTCREICPTSKHRRCSMPCQLGAIGRCSLPPLPRLNFYNLFCFRHG
jgi:hypothetical protein